MKSVEEWSSQFDVLLNNVSSNQAPGYDEYEKSIFLTKGQDEVLKNYLLPQSNPKKAGFDDNSKRQIDFSTLMKRATLIPVQSKYIIDKFDPKSLLFCPPDDLFIVRNEQLLGSMGVSYTVLPISYETYDKQMSKPYKYPPKYQAWRLFTDATVVDEGSADVVWAESVDSSIHMTYMPIEEYTISFEVEVGPAITSEVSHALDTDNHTLDITVYQNSTSETISSMVGNIDRYIRQNGLLQYFQEFSVGGGGNQIINYVPAGTGRTEILNVSKTGGEYHTVSPAIEIRGVFNTTSPTYKLRYVRKPKPIVLVHLEDGLKIEGESGPLTSELPEELHEEILQRAVELAKNAWQGDVKSTVELGTRSE